MRSLRGTILALGAALGAVGVAGMMEMGCGDDTSGTTTDWAPIRPPMAPV